MNFPAADVMGRLRAKLDSSGEQTKAVVTEYDTESLGLIERWRFCNRKLQFWALENDDFGATRYITESLVLTGKGMNLEELQVFYSQNDGFTVKMMYFVVKMMVFV